MTEPKQPADHPPTEESSAETKPVHGAHAPNGVPPAADEADAKGMPNSDRHRTETAASPAKHD